MSSRVVMGVLAVFVVACRGNSAPPSGPGPIAEPAPTPVVSQVVLPPMPPVPREAFPNPLISRGKPVFATALAKYAHPEAVNDGVYNTFAGTWNAGTPSATQPATVAIQVGAGPSRVLFEWSAGANYNYTDTEYGSPGSYRIETSADSRDGTDGTWKLAATNASCTVHGQAHAIPFVGQSWVRMVITGMPPKSPNGVQLDEIEVYDVSSGVSDSWFFFGDSIAALVFNRTTPVHQPSFAALVHEKDPRFFPAMINGGIGGIGVVRAAEQVDAWLALNPDMHYWAIGLGTNDAAGNNQDTTVFKHALSTIIEKVKAAGHVPIVARIPFSSDGQHDTVMRFNAVIAEVTADHELLPGPDLYTWFQAHPDQLRDGIHPTDVGALAINRLWAEAVASLHAR